MPAGAATYRIAGDLNCSAVLGEKLCESLLMQRRSYVKAYPYQQMILL